MGSLRQPDQKFRKSRRQVWLVICVGSAFLAVGVAFIRHGLKSLSEGRVIPSEISRLEKSFTSDGHHALKATLDGFTRSASALESPRVKLENKVEGLKRQRATRDEEIKRLKIEGAKAEEEKKKNELHVGDWVSFVTRNWRVPLGPYYPESGGLEEKLYGKVVNKLNGIRDSLAKAEQAYAILCEQIDEIAAQARVIESQLMVLNTQVESATKNAERQLKDLLNADPRLVQLRERKAWADGFGNVLQLLHLLTGSLCILVACKSTLRAMQLAGRLTPHTLVREIRSNG